MTLSAHLSVSLSQRLLGKESLEHSWDSSNYSASSCSTTNHLSTLQIWKGPNPLKSSLMKQQSSSQLETPAQTAPGLTAQEGFG
ncbi:hypothetical protein Q8A67_019302 [Cirrhinus molitorella]|uniref:Uncharacterized protein n=1 Tax=Cirrhinus molitorella TaxID=172907 RepID=A0AA88PC49_9TELE|nr:hypothetical protein Q8A67_019302 [Cirrhinus molitorella]